MRSSILVLVSLVLGGPLGPAQHIRAQSPAPSGTVFTIAGNGSISFSGDGGPATNATMWGVLGIAVDGARNVLYFADIDNNRVRQVNLTNGIISPFAGCGLFCFGHAGDGGPAAQASLGLPYDLAVDRIGNVYIADDFNGRVRKVDCRPANTISST